MNYACHVESIQNQIDGDQSSDHLLDLKSIPIVKSGKRAKTLKCIQSVRFAQEQEV
jgi:hypothetical protein